MDLARWSNDEYDWRSDDWNGMKDFAKQPRRTYETGYGDCEDYALVVASALASRGRTDLHFAVVTSGIVPEHVVLYDVEAKRVYSSGRIFDSTLESYVATSRYSRCATRRIA